MEEGVEGAQMAEEEVEPMYEQDKDNGYNKQKT